MMMAVTPTSLRFRLPSFVSPPGIHMSCIVPPIGRTLEVAMAKYMKVNAMYKKRVVRTALAFLKMIPKRPNFIWERREGMRSVKDYINQCIET